MKDFLITIALFATWIAGSATPIYIFALSWWWLLASAPLTLIVGIVLLHMLADWR